MKLGFFASIAFHHILNVGVQKIGIACIILPRLPTFVTDRKCQSFFLSMSRVQVCFATLVLGAKAETVLFSSKIRGHFKSLSLKHFMT